jgi:TetR/AcrR family transcriptional repressor of lmrAB and yxaGH operons
MSTASPREQMVEAASRLFARQGYRSTTMRGIVDEAGAPWGSLQHYWPGGKEQLGAAAVQFGDQRVRGLITHCLDSTDTVADAVAKYCAVVGRVLEESGWTDGCPVTTVALEVASDGTAVTEACVAAFNGWCGLWAGGLRAGGVPTKRSKELGVSLVGGINGALAMARVTRSTAPLKLAAESLRALVGQPS